MAGTPLQYPVYAATLTLTTTPQNLLTLLQAIGGRYLNCPSSSRSYQIQADPANTPKALIGDENLALSPQQCGQVLSAGVVLTDRATMPYIAPFGSLWGASATSTALVNVMVWQ